MHRTFLHTFFGTENCAHRLHQKNTQRFFCAQRLYPGQFLHGSNSSAQKPLRTDFFKCTAIITDRWFLHIKFSAQKSYAQKVLHTTVFLHTDAAFIHRCLYMEDELHKETCAHSTVLHATNFYTERFCFPFLITYLSRSPSQVEILILTCLELELLSLGGGQ